MAEKLSLSTLVLDEDQLELVFKLLHGACSEEGQGRLALDTMNLLWEASYGNPNRPMADKPSDLGS